MHSEKPLQATHSTHFAANGGKFQVKSKELDRLRHSNELNCACCDQRNTLCPHPPRVSATALRLQPPVRCGLQIFVTLRRFELCPRFDKHMLVDRVEILMRAQLLFSAFVAPKTQRCRRKIASVTFALRATRDRKSTRLNSSH